MKKNLIILFISLIPLIGFAQFQWKTIDKLEGTWQVEGKPQFEVWAKTEDYKLAGEGFQVNEKGEKKHLEGLVISGNPKGDIYYTATVPNQNEGASIPFHLSAFDKKNLIFENPKHDFPQKIHYQLKGRKKLSVHVSAGEKGFVVKMTKVKD